MAGLAYSRSLFVISIALIAFSAAAAGAQTRGGTSRCTFDASAGTLLVEGAGLGEITVARGLAEHSEVIQARYRTRSIDLPVSGTLDCADPASGAQPAVTTVDAVTVRGTADLSVDLSNGALAPGKTSVDEGGSPEIEVMYDAPPKGGIVPRLTIVMRPLAADGHSSAIQLGSLATGPGANVNPREETPASADADVLSTGVAVSVTGTSASDAIDGSGGAGFEGPLESHLAASAEAGNDQLIAGKGRVSFNGGSGDDELRGSPGNDDVLADGPGEDVARGFGGDDDFEVGTGDDRYLAGAGARDEVWPQGGTGGIHIDLRKTEAQVAGSLGVDTFRNFEWLHGTRWRDVLIGNSGPNLLADNNGGADRFVGNGGDDRLFGLYGNDAIIGGAGEDRLFGGNDDDELVGGPSADVFQGGTGFDRLLARDGRADRRIDCGSGSGGDVARSDPEDPLPTSC